MTEPTPATAQPETLLPCPACGSKDVMLHDPSDDTRDRFVRCIDCRMRGPNTSTAYAAVTQWDRMPRVVAQRKETTKEEVCTCHERDSSYACPVCFAQGLRGHMQGDPQTDD